jgi:hypothetical protein
VGTATARPAPRGTTTTTDLGGASSSGAALQLPARLQAELSLRVEGSGLPVVSESRSYASAEAAVSGAAELAGER